MELKIFCDGGSRGNPGPSAWAFIVYDEKNQVLAQNNGKMGIATNNVAEYTAVAKALEWMRDNREKKGVGPIRLKVVFSLDSNLVVSQLNGLFKVKNSKLRELVVDIRSLEQAASADIIYQHIPREKNSAADFLVNRALDSK
ncbi:MAG: ribonuclease HI family protein [bacterium]|nr:ribonuclease HI family protein [bacterium]